MLHPTSFVNSNSTSQHCQNLSRKVKKLSQIVTHSPRKQSLAQSRHHCQVQLHLSPPIQTHKPHSQIQELMVMVMVMARVRVMVVSRVRVWSRNQVSENIDRPLIDLSDRVR